VGEEMLLVCAAVGGFLPGVGGDGDDGAFGEVGEGGVGVGY